MTNHQSQLSAVKYLDKCFSMSFKQYDYEATSPDLFKQMFKIKCPPLAFKQAILAIDALATGVLRPRR